MAVKNLLAKNKLEDFKSWLVGDGAKIEATKGYYQLLRFRYPNDSKPHIIYDSHNPMYLSLENRTAPIVRRFLRSNKINSISEM